MSRTKTATLPHAKPASMTEKELFDFWTKYWNFLQSRPGLNLEAVRQLLDDIEQELLGWPEEDETVNLETCDGSAELYDWLSDWGTEQTETYGERVGNAEEDIFELEGLIDQYGAEYIPPRPPKHPRDDAKKAAKIAKQAKADRKRRDKELAALVSYLKANPTAKPKQVSKVFAVQGIDFPGDYVAMIKRNLRKAK